MWNEICAFYGILLQKRHLVHFFSAICVWVLAHVLDKRFVRDWICVWVPMRVRVPMRDQVLMLSSDACPSSDAYPSLSPCLSPKLVSTDPQVQAVLPLFHLSLDANKLGTRDDKRKWRGQTTPILHIFLIFKIESSYHKIPIPHFRFCNFDNNMQMRQFSRPGRWGKRMFILFNCIENVFFV